MPHRLAVIGDLHYEPEQHEQFVAARRVLLDQGIERIIQMGDQGGYSHPGTWQSFMEGREFLEAFRLPWHTLVGNHDLEGSQYSTDDAALAAWCQAFDHRRPWQTAELGEVLGIFLSTTRFRSNVNCRHEIYLDQEQLDWFTATLADNRQRLTFVFTHAPILGSGIRVLRNLHLKCPNAYLNHTDRPERLMQLARANPQIKLWFSAHNHLGQGYPDSVHQVGDCTFVHTGVMGDITRDGDRHGRLVEFDRAGFSLFTIDYVSGEVTRELVRNFLDADFERLARPGRTGSILQPAPPAYPGDDGLRDGESVLLLDDGMVLEYDVGLAAPLGVVAEGIDDARLARDGDELLLIRSDGSRRRLGRNPQGRYYSVYVPNPGRLNGRLSAR